MLADIWDTRFGRSLWDNQTPWVTDQPMRRILPRLVSSWVDNRNRILGFEGGFLSMLSIFMNHLSRNIFLMSYMTGVVWHLTIKLRLSSSILSSHTGHLIRRCDQELLYKPMKLKVGSFCFDMTRSPGLVTASELSNYHWPPWGSSLSPLLLSFFSFFSVLSSFSIQSHILPSRFYTLCWFVGILYSFNLRFTLLT